MQLSGARKHGRGAVAYIVTEQMQQIKPCGQSPGEGLQTPAGSFLRSCGCQTTSKPQAAILNNRQLRVTKRAVCSSLWAVSQEMTEDGCCDIWPLKSWGPCPPPVENNGMQLQECSLQCSSVHGLEAPHQDVGNTWKRKKRKEGEDGEEGKQ